MGKRKGYNIFTRSKQISEGLEKRILLDGIEIKLRFSVLKSLHAQWLMDAFNFMTSEAGNEVISKGWKAAGITYALSKGLNGMENLDPLNPSILLSSKTKPLINQINLATLSNNYF